VAHHKRLFGAFHENAVGIVEPFFEPVQKVEVDDRRAVNAAEVTFREAIFPLFHGLLRQSFLSRGCVNLGIITGGGDVHDRLDGQKNVLRVDE